MAIHRICSIEGCGKPTSGRGWCNRHYKRWSAYGDPLFTKTAGDGEPHAFLEEIAFPFTGTECLIWPYGKNDEGYGHIRIGRGRATAHRLACIHRNGPPPTPRHQAAHSCGNVACCNPFHLRWATARENSADRVGHGTDCRGENNGRAKLTAENVMEIRSLGSELTQAVIAERFGIERSVVSRIISKKAWSSV